MADITTRGVPFSVQERGASSCQQQLRIPGTEPVLYRPCKHPVAEGETHCARHGGFPIRPRRQRALLARLRRAWRALMR